MKYIEGCLSWKRKDDQYFKYAAQAFLSENIDQRFVVIELSYPSIERDEQVNNKKKKTSTHFL